MKRIIPVLVLIILAFSCRKEKHVNPDEVRLLRLESQQGGNTYRTNFEYDGSGRINKVTAQQNNQPATILCTITYNSNEVIITDPPITVTGSNITNEVRLTLDGEKRVIKRIQYSFLEFTPPANNPQRTYIYDTLVYEYDAAGLLKKITGSNYDTTWYNPGTPATSAIRSTSVANYTTTSNNLTAINKVTNFVSTSNPGGGGTFVTLRSMEDNQVLQYTRAYSNATDFSNVAILNELHAFSLSPLNKKYTSLPEKVTTTVVNKDQAGNVLSTDNGVSNVTLAYNSYGFLSTVTVDASGPVRFVYNQ